MATTMKIIGRMNLAGNPTMPVMPSEGVMYYKSDNVTLRRVVFGVGETIITNACPNRPTGRSACIVGDCYFYMQSWSGVDLDSPLINVNINTGVVNFNNAGTPRSSQGTVRPVANGNFGGVIVNNGSNNSNILWMQKNTNVITLAQSFWPGPIWSGYAGTSGTVWVDPVTFENYQLFGVELWAVKFAVAPNNTSVKKNNFIKTLIAGQNIVYNAQGSGYPGMWVDDAEYFYGFAGNLTAGNKLVSYRIGKDGGQFHQDYVTHAGHVYNANAGYDSLAISLKHKRIAFAAGTALGARIFSSPLWPTDLTNFIDVDVTTQINGVWVFPPFIYVAKNLAGTGFTQQLIKIYDSALDAQGHNPRLGSRSKLRF